MSTFSRLKEENAALKARIAELEAQLAEQADPDLLPAYREAIVAFNARIAEIEATVPEPEPEPTPEPEPEPEPEPTPEPEPVPDPTDAASLNDFASAVAAAVPGDTIKLIPDVYAPQPITINVAGTPGAPIVIDMTDCTIRGGRNTGADSVPWQPPVDMSGARNVKQQPAWGNVGPNFITLGSGAAYLTFIGGSFEQLGRAFSFAADGVHHIAFLDQDFYNCQDYYWSRYSLNEGAHHLTWDGCGGLGYSKSAIRLSGNTNFVHIKDCHFDSGFQSNDEFADGLKIGLSSANTSGSQVHNVLVERSTFTRNVDVEGTGKFWNGDGCSIERGDFNIMFRESAFSFNSDAGLDTKGTNIWAIDCTFHDNKANVKCWGELNLVNGWSDDAHKAEGAPFGDPNGGTGAVMQIQVQGGSGPDDEGAKVHLYGTWESRDDRAAWTLNAVANAENGQVWNADVFDHRPNVPDVPDFLAGWN